MHTHTDPYPRNCILEGPREIIRDASPSPSTRGGGVVSFCGLTRRQVMRVGAAQVRGGMITRRPLCLLPRMEPPLASTMKLTRNLSNNQPVSKPGTMTFQNSRKPSIKLKHLQKNLLPRHLMTVKTGIKISIYDQQINTEIKAVRSH